MSGSWVRFRVCGSWYALPLQRIAEVTEARSAFLIPGVERELAGVVNLRGEPLAVVDGGRLFGHDASDRRYALVLDFERERVGLLVDAISRIEHQATPPEPEPGGEPLLVVWPSGRDEAIGWVQSDVLLERVSSILRPGNPQGETPCPSGS